MRSLLRTDAKSCLMSLKGFQRNDFILQEVTLTNCHETGSQVFTKPAVTVTNAILTLAGFWSLWKSAPLSLEFTLFYRWRMITTDVCIEGFIDWMAPGTAAKLFCVPSLILVLDFPAPHQNSAAVAQKLGILVMILGQLFSCYCIYFWDSLLCPAMLEMLLKEEMQGYVDMFSIASHPFCT